MFPRVQQQFREAKSRHPGMLLFFRNGDFCELFAEDAELAREFGLTVTKRYGSDDFAMAGFPAHRLEHYLGLFLKSGKRCAVIDPKPEEAPMKKATQPAADHPLRHNRTESKRDPFKGVAFNVPAGEESLRHVHRARAAVPASGLVAFRVTNAYTFYHGDAVHAAAVANLTLFKFGKVDSAEFPCGDVERIARAIHDTGRTLHLADPADAFPVAYDLPPPAEVQADIRGRYEVHAADLRHVRGSCYAYWTMKDGKYAAHKGRKVDGAQVGPFVVHTEPDVRYAVTHESSGLRLGALPFASMSEAKLFALLAGWNHSWDFPGKNFPEDEVAFITSLIKAWKANRWDIIAKLCTLDSEPLVNEAEDVTDDRSFSDGHASEDAKLAIPPAPVHVDKPTQPTLSVDAVKLHEHIRGGKCDFKTLSALLDFDTRRTVEAVRELRDVGFVRHVEQSASGPLAQNFGPGDSFEIVTKSA